MLVNNPWLLWLYLHSMAIGVISWLQKVSIWQRLVALNTAALASATMSFVNKQQRELVRLATRLATHCVTQNDRFLRVYRSLKRKDYVEKGYLMNADNGAIKNYDKIT